MCESVWLGSLEQRQCLWLKQRDSVCVEVVCISVCIVCVREGEKVTVDGPDLNPYRSVSQ